MNIHQRRLFTLGIDSPAVNVTRAMLRKAKAERVLACHPDKASLDASASEIQRRAQEVRMTMDAYDLLMRSYDYPL